MSYKVVRNVQGDAVAFGPNDNNYEPFIKGGEFLTVEADAPSFSVTVPQQVPKVAAELALIEAGMDTLPATYFATLSGKPKKRAQALWDKNPVVKLSSPVLQAAIAAGAITQAQVNALMIAADVIARNEL